MPKFQHYSQLMKFQLDLIVNRFRNDFFKETGRLVRLRLTAVFIFPVLLFIGPCDSAEPVASSSRCVKVSYIDGICLEAVLRIEDEGAARYGETWNGNENVFYGIFPCGTDWQRLISGPVYVEILDAPESPSCVKCMAKIDYTGKKIFPVKIAEGCAD